MMRTPAERAYAKKHYSENKARYRERAIACNARARAKIRQWLTAYLSAHPCVDCGESDQIVLEFDHLDPTTKRYNITDMAQRGQSLSLVQIEVSKCAVRCANCHRRRTYYQRKRGELRHKAISGMDEVIVMELPL